VRSLLMAESPESFVRPSNLSPAKLDGMGMFCGDVDVRNGRGGEMWVSTQQCMLSVNVYTSQCFFGVWILRGRKIKDMMCQTSGSESPSKSLKIGAATVDAGGALRLCFLRIMLLAFASAMLFSVARGAFVVFIWHSKFIR